MKRYVVTYDTIIAGRPQVEGDTVTLDDEKAKVYLSAGLIKLEEVPVANEPAKVPAKKADK